MLSAVSPLTDNQWAAPMMVKFNWVWGWGWSQWTLRKSLGSTPALHNLHMLVLAGKQLRAEVQGHL